DYILKHIEALGLLLRLAPPRPPLRAGVVARAVEIAVDAAAAEPILRDRARPADLVDVRLLGERHPIRVVPRAGDDLVESPEALIRLAPPASGGEFVHHVVELHAQERVGDGMELRRRQLGARCLSDPVPELPAGLVRRLRVSPDVLRRE